VRDGDVIWLQREVSDTDEYGRILRHVWIKHPDNVHDESEVRAKMLDAVLVDQGYAQSKRYSPDTYYNDMFDEFMQDACNDGRGVSYVWAESES
jgi:micrococcal nuclease